jgi:diadenosine tetraphosphate (Ap4A) HIT family hydrolase
MKLLEDCNFCNVKPGDKSQIYERTIIETPNFRVFPTLGQIAEGYLLIVPKEHYACVGAMPEPVLDEMIELKDEVDRRLTEAYQKPIFFEHGVIGQTVLHAHMHAVPCKPDNYMMRFFDYNLGNYEPIESIKELRNVWQKHGVYIFFEADSNKSVFCSNIPPMGARIALARALDVPERANWRTMDRKLDEELIERTMAKLKR